MTFQEGSLETLERINNFDSHIKDYLFKNHLTYPEANTALIMILVDLNISMQWQEEEFMKKVRLTWKLVKEFKTRGFDADQTESAIKATERMLNIIENIEQKTMTNKKLIDVTHGF